MEVPCPTPSSERPHKRSSAQECLAQPSNKRTCTADLLRFASLETGGSLESCDEAAAGLGWLAAAASAEASPAAPASAAADTPFASTQAQGQGSAESSQSLAEAPLAPAPRSAAAEAVAVVAPAHAAAAAAAAAAAHEAEAEAAAAEGAGCAPHSLLPTCYLAELAAANECLKRLPLPGGIPYHPVHSSCAMLPMCCHYGIPPAAVALGASYFQRLLAGSEHLRDTALACGFFSWVTLPALQAGAPPRQEVVMHAVPGQADLLTILATCVYLGTKVTDGPQFARQLSHMLSQVLGAHVPSHKAVDLEMRCLKNLQWRLGPYCCAPSSAARV